MHLHNIYINEKTKERKMGAHTQLNHLKEKPEEIPV